MANETNKFEINTEFNYSRRMAPKTPNADPNTTYSSAASAKSEPRLTELWRQHAGALWENGRHKDSCYAFIHEIDAFMRLQKIATYDDILIDRLVNHFREIDNRNSTINRKLSALYRLLRKAERSGQIARLPTYLRLRERNSRVRFLTAEEEAAMFGAIGARNVHHELLCRFLVDTGARIGEALALKWGDIHNNTATFWVTKSGKSRSVPLTDRAAQALDAARAFGGSGPFAAISYPNFKYNWNQARKDNRFAGDPHMVPHILRHTCASRLVQAGIDLRRVQTFLGHQTIQMTLRYAHLATNDLDQCAIALNAVNSAHTLPPKPRPSQPLPRSGRSGAAKERPGKPSATTIRSEEKTVDSRAGSAAG
ncbi:tyrosine-type recombinase/integrase [Hoeflea sp. YIM 152468]|uniref:tyrosine-type recombinase/integrase n=1 Tax=Hoeflea sp. YIM 152468 TaxID=3031759 RepID=UPI0023DC7E08|nr:tyrosine-type recombinase/integrase [Hoeflea sp. YIM 152468]MDF1607720.1 tyrosine-type recombinase/integrase [Hoeflea sp. YIM 152468]